MAVVHAADSSCVYLVLPAPAVSYWEVALLAVAHSCMGGGMRSVAGACVYCAKTWSVRKEVPVRQPVWGQCCDPWPNQRCRGLAVVRRATRSIALPDRAFAPIARGGTSADKMVRCNGGLRDLLAHWCHCRPLPLARRQ